MIEAEDQDIEFYSDSEKNWYDEFFCQSEDDEFIDDSIDENNEQTDEIFYQKMENRKQYVKFLNQTIYSIKTIYENHADFFGEEDLPELFDPEDREQVEFNEFHSAKTFKKIQRKLFEFFRCWKWIFLCCYLWNFA